MTGEQALLQAVCAEPDDDGPRLVYADWLEEHGNPARADFIRLQCERARLLTEDPRRQALQSRERELLETYTAEWLAPLEPWLFEYGPGPSSFFQRGFVEELTAWVDPFLKDAAGLFAPTPLRHVALPSVNGRDCARLAEEPLLLRLQGFSPDIVDSAGEGLTQLLLSPYLANLTHLHLSGRPSCFLEPDERRPLIDSRRLRLLLYASHLKRLEVLDLRANGLDRQAGELIATAPTLAGLRCLDLDENFLDDHAALALAASPYLGRIERLSLRHNRIHAAGLAALQERFGDLVELVEPEAPMVDVPGEGPEPGMDDDHYIPF
jgi:uncharacterized protein (TIGR02996 family)